MSNDSEPYRDIEGDPCTLYQLVRKEPGWAASRIRKCEQLEERFDRQKSVVVTIDGVGHYVSPVVAEWVEKWKAVVDKCECPR